MWLAPLAVASRLYGLNSLHDLNSLYGINNLHGLNSLRGLNGLREPSSKRNMHFLNFRPRMTSQVGSEVIRSP